MPYTIGSSLNKPLLSFIPIFSHSLLLLCATRSLPLIYTHFQAQSRKMKPLLATFLLVFLVLSSSFVQNAMAGSSFCDSKCAARCSKAGMKDRCLKYCGICCEECKCVPSGTYGNKHECPCYKDKKNSKGQPKCP